MTRLSDARLSDERALWLSRHVLPHEPALRAWLSKKRIPGLEVDDLVQETYAKLIMLENVSAIVNPRAYVFQTAYSILINHVRRSRVVSFQAVHDIDQLGVMADEATPEDTLIGRDELYRLAQAISGLPGKIRDVFVLRRVKGLSQREVAKTLNLSESTVEKHMSRGFFLLMGAFSHGGNAEVRTSRAWGTKLRTTNAKRDSQSD